MNIRLLFTLLPVFTFFVSHQLIAQNTSIEITGTVISKRTQQPVEFATVMIGDPATETPLTGTTTDLDGTFTVTAEQEDFYLEISFIGFTNTRIANIEVQNGMANLGRIELAENDLTLNEVLVTAEKSSTEFKLDKRVFNVGKDISSTGQSALEVLNNVPSVNVNIEGQVTLRGSTGVQILINGKPSVLASEEGNALGTITADMIDRIEVITNPSAKYDAEGTSGIINIVIKKDERKGLNGSFSINTGWPHNHSFGLSMNRRTEKFNLFTQMGVGYRELPSDEININRDLINNITVYSDGIEYRNENFYTFTLGTDYHINEFNVLTLSGNFAYEIEDQPSQTLFTFTDANDVFTSQWQREETTEALNPKWQYELQYKKEFRDNKDHTFLFSSLGNFFGKSQSSDFINTNFLNTHAPPNQQTRTDFQEAKYTFTADYTQPFNEKWTLEAGTQYVLQDVSNDFAVSNLVNETFVPDENLTNVFDYQQNVLGLYATGAYEQDKWGLKAGLRLENTDLTTLLINTNEENLQNYTNLFPSGHASYKLTEQISLQAGYSRRVYRPRLWDLNPFFNIRNNFSIRVGNPDLLPEFTDSYELSSIYILGELSLNFSVFHRYTSDVIERVSIFENNVNTFKPLNIGTNRSTGVEFNFKYSPSKWLSLNGDANYNYFNRQGIFDATSFDFNADRWSSKLTAKLKLPAGIDFEATGHFESAFQTVQGTVAQNLFADLGLRKKILKNKGVINFSIRDVFASRIRQNITEGTAFYVFSRQQRGRFITLGFSYGFGKGEAMEYSGRRR